MKDTLSKKYRPKKLDGIIGQEKIVKALKNILQTGSIPHLLFSGPPGCGKTSTAFAFASELGYPIVEFNASDDRGINTIRERIKILSFTSGKRIILLDEADNMTSDAQQALRRIMEKCSPEVRYILTCNSIRKLIDAIKSRCAIFYFSKLSDQDVLRTLLQVLKEVMPNFKLTDEVKQGLIELVKISDGDLRKALNILETIITSKQEITIDTIKLQIPPNFGSRILKIAFEGRWADALKELEDTYILNNQDSDKLIEQLWHAIVESDVEDYIKWKLFEKLSETETAIRMGCNPLIQLSGFLSVVWISKFVPK